MTKLALGISHQQEGTTIVGMTPRGEDKWLVVSNSFHPEGDSSLLIDIPDVPQWRRVQDSLPEVGQWCLVTIDRSYCPEYWKESETPRYAVYSAHIHRMDGRPFWMRAITFDCGPIWEIDCIIAWIPYPEHFQQSA